MKIQIRMGMFETNSSSSHSLIITNKKRMKKDYDKMIKENHFFYPEYITEEDKVETKEDKVLMLSGLFDYENRYGLLKEERKIFIKVLKKNNENELLEKIKKYRKQYKHSPEPYCTSYYYQGCLDQCTCCFYNQFKKYFKYPSIEVNASLIRLSKKQGFDSPTDEFAFMKKTIRKNKKILYKKLYEFIYGDGMILPYCVL